MIAWFHASMIAGVFLGRNPARHGAGEKTRWGQVTKREKSTTLHTIRLAKYTIKYIILLKHLKHLDNQYKWRYIYFTKKGRAMLTESIYTLEEVSQYLRVSVDILLQEIAAGRLQALKIADLMRIEESALKAYKEAAKAGSIPSTANSESVDNFLKQILPAPDFTHKWPDGSNEDFKNAQECVALYRGRE